MLNMINKQTNNNNHLIRRVFSDITWEGQNCSVACMKFKFFLVPIWREGKKHTKNLKGVGNDNFSTSNFFS